MPKLTPEGRREPLVPGTFDAKFLVSMEPKQLEQIWADARKLHISRNEYIRRAVYAYMEKIDNEGDF